MILNVFVHHIFLETGSVWIKLGREKGWEKTEPCKIFGGIAPGAPVRGSGDWQIKTCIVDFQLKLKTSNAKQFGFDVCAKLRQIDWVFGYACYSYSRDECFGSLQCVLEG